MTNETKAKIIAGAALVAVIIASFIDPVSQDPEYHAFADQRVMLSIAHFWNVVTNIPFVVIGAMGVLLLASGNAAGGLPELKPLYLLFFLGVLATGFSSAYYHLNPGNGTLLWDRITMTVVFMAFFSAIVGEHISIDLGRKLVWPLIVLGICSVLYWIATEKAGHGDLRFYGVVQYLPMLLIPLILLLYRSQLAPVSYIWWVLAAYLVSKAAEMLDQPIYAAFYIISGHSLKHLAAAFGAFLFYVALRRRSRPDHRRLEARS